MKLETIAVESVTTCNGLQDSCEQTLQGSGAEIREAIAGIRNTANSALTALSIGNCPSSLLWDIVRKCEAALAEPPRNCDVGSAKEQYRRFCICCTKHKMPCRRSYTFGCAECYAHWVQVPYEEGGAE